MRKFLRVSGVNLSSSTPIESISDDGKAMGSPYWSVLMDPDYMSLPSGLSHENVTLNRAEGNNMPTRRSTPAPSIIGGDGEKRLIRVDDSGVEFWYLTPNKGFNPSEWTAFFVIDASVSSRARNYLASTGDMDNTAATPALSVGFVDDTMIVYETANDTSGQPQRISVNAGLTGRGLTLLMATFSEDRGLSLIVNGEIVARNPDDKRPLASGYGPGEYNLFRYCRGDYGMAGLLDIDMSRPAMREQLESMSSHIIEQYGIEV